MDQRVGTLPAEGARSARRPAAARLLPALAVVLGGLFVAGSTIALALACRSPVPVWDQWDNLVTGRTLTLSWLFSQHNEHRILFPRLVFALDALLFHERNDVDLAATVLLQGASAALLIALSLRLERPDRAGVLVRVGFVLALTFSAVQWENFIWGFQVTFVMLCAAAVAAFAALGLDGRRRAVALSLLASAVAAFSLASGVLVAVLAVVLSVWQRRARGETVAVALGAAGLTLLYLWGYAQPPRHDNPFASLADLLPVAFYVLNELGTPPALLLGFDTFLVRIDLGALGLLALAALVVTVRRSPGEPSGRAERALLMLALFIALMSLLTGLGRIRFGIEQATAVRYATPVLLFWMALALVGVARLPRRFTPTGQAVLAAVVLAAALGQARFAPAATAVARLRAAALPALLVPTGDRDLLTHIHPNPAAIAPHLPALAAARASVFAADWAGWLGKAMPGPAPPAGLRTCRGDPQSKVTLEAGWRAGGRLERGERVMRVVALDAAGTVVGLGLGGLDALAVGDVDGGFDDGRADRWSRRLAAGPPDRWLAEVASPADATVSLFALDDAGRWLCRLPGG